MLPRLAALQDMRRVENARSEAPEGLHVDERRLAASGGRFPPERWFWAIRAGDWELVIFKYFLA